MLDDLHKHHITTLPATVGDYSQLDAGSEASVTQRVQSVLPAKFDGEVTHLQAAVYAQGTVTGVLVAVADVPAGSQRHSDAAFQNEDGTDGYHDVVAPVSGFGGTVRCTTAPSGSSSAEVCAWIDNGTLGLVIAFSADEATTLQLLGEIRSASEP